MLINVKRIADSAVKLGRVRTIESLGLRDLRRVSVH
jgi:hypothetical protein